MRLFDKNGHSMTGFAIPDNTLEELLDWQEEHMKTVHHQTRTPTDLWTYEFTPAESTALCKCNICYNKAVSFNRAPEVFTWRMH